MWWLKPVFINLFRPHVSEVSHTKVKLCDEKPEKKNKTFLSWKSGLEVKHGSTVWKHENWSYMSPEKHCLENEDNGGSSTAVDKHTCSCPDTVMRVHTLLKRCCSDHFDCGSRLGPRVLPEGCNPDKRD